MGLTRRPLRGSGEVARDQIVDGAAHRASRVVRPLLPREDAGRQDAVEIDLPEPREEGLEVDLSLTDIQMLMDPGSRPGRVDDVAQPARGAVVEAVGQVDLGHAVSPA